MAIKKTAKPKKSVALTKVEESDTEYNLTHVVNKGGRPMKFPTPESLYTGIESYVKYCLEKEEPITISGMCLALGTTRETLREYRLKPEYTDVLKRATLLVANSTETRMLKNKLNPVAGIFYLTNLDPENWKQKSEVQHSGQVLLGVIQVPPKLNQSSARAVND